ncbi:DUF397 domain-containing protein [Streptomyces sp. NPDC004732]|uniref:DUF397 domain-containing protein n=1 Tax=Streptomyces sp. NPDC004732 TaxID=3154290 RepID=UPI0033B15C4F
MGTLTNGSSTIAYEQSNAPGLDWRKSGRTDLDPILKECVIVAAAPDAKDHPHEHVPDGTRMVAVSDDKDTEAHVLLFTRAEFTNFVVSAKAGEFDEFLATEEEMEAAQRIGEAADMAEILSA